MTAETGSGKSTSTHRRIVDERAQLLEVVSRGTQEISGRLCGDMRVLHQPQAYQPRLHLFTCRCALCANMSQRRLYRSSNHDSGAKRCLTLHEKALSASEKRGLGVFPKLVEGSFSPRLMPCTGTS